MQTLIYQLLISWGLEAGIATFLAISIILISVLFISFVACLLAHFLLNNHVNKITRKLIHSNQIRKLDALKITSKIIAIIPPVLFLLSSPLLIIKNHTATIQFSNIISDLSSLLLLYYSVRFIFTLLDFSLLWYKNLNINSKHPVRSYVQFIKIFLVSLAIILTISIILNRSPAALLTGVGALSAVILFVFKDTITGFISSIQVSANDLVRVGDWITMPSLHADGDVEEITINTVKIRNFDKTIVTIPTHSLINSGVQNWRGMTESGGRRIKRALNIDIDSIKFCDDELFTKISHIAIISERINTLDLQAKEDNQSSHSALDNPLNSRQFTNIGLFRYYIENYLKSLPTISQSHTFLIRQLAPNQFGLPLEIYVFTNNTNWNQYEQIQADIFDHLLAATKTFELKVFQLDRGLSHIAT